MRARGNGVLTVGAFGLSVCLVAAVSIWLSLRHTLPLSSMEHSVADNTSLQVVKGSAVLVTPRENVGPAHQREVAAFEQHLKAEPTDTLAIARLAQLFESSRQPEQAARYYRRLLTINRNSRLAWIGLARVYAAVENWEAAEGALATLLEIVPGDPAAMYHLGAIHADRGDYLAARRWWQKVQQQGSDPQLAKRATESLERIGGSSS